MLTYTVNGFQNSDNGTVVSGAAAVSTTAATNSPVGPYPIAITNGTLSAANYGFSFSNNVLTVTPATLLVAANNQSRPYGATNPVLIYNISGFLGTDTVSVVSGVPGLSTTAVSNSPNGTYPIVITNINLSATNYGFTFTNGTLTVGQAELLVSADNQARTYGATNPVLTYTISGFLGTDTVSVVSGTAGTATGAATNSAVGPYPITVTNINLSATNYSFNFTNGQLTVNPATLLVTADNQSRQYGATNPVLTYTVSGFQNSDNGTVVSGAAAVSTTAATNSPVGPYLIAITNGTLSAANYGFSFSNNVLTVAPATLLVAANNQSRPYGATNPVLTYNISGFLGTDTVSVVSGVPGLSTTAVSNSPNGTYPIVITNINLSATNYGFTFTNGQLTVGQAVLLVSADNQARTYGATNPVLTYTISGFLGTDTVAVVSGTAGTATAATTNSGVGPYPITVTNINLSATNYSFNFTNGQLTVNPATLLVTADNQSRQYGATNPVLTYTISGFQNADPGSVVSGTPALNTVANNTSPVATYPITVTNGSLAATNYGFAFSNGTLTVTPTPPLILSVTGAGTANVVITWSALSNVTYRVQYESNFFGTNWQSLVPDVTATNNAASTVDNPDGANQRFYRVLVP